MAEIKKKVKRDAALSPVARFSVRLLPVTIFVAALVLSVRVNDIWLGVMGHPLFPSLTNVAEAQQATPPGGRVAGQPTPADNAGAAASAAQPTPPAQAENGAAAAGSQPAPAQTAAAPGNSSPQAATPPEAPPAVLPVVGERGEPSLFTANEVSVLERLAERREALEARERDILLREQMLSAAESRLDRKIEEMKALQASMEAMLKQIDAEDERKLKSLVKIYEAMKPKEAAKIFNELDLPVLLSVVAYMKEQNTAQIMQVMDPLKAKDLTDAIAQRRGDWIKGQEG